jgi:adenylate cyclase class 2
MKGVYKMHTEYEARVLEINKEELEKNLEKLGAKKVADFDYKRRIYDFHPKTEDKWIRLRTNGIKTTLTIKEIESTKIDGTKETEIEVSNFEEANIILNKLGYESRAYQENKRTRYTLNGVEIDIDTWPYIPTYVEIEGSSVDEVKKTVKTLNLDESKLTSIDVQGIYREFYNIDIAEMPILKFGEELDQKYIIKNK